MAYITNWQKSWKLPQEWLRWSVFVPSSPFSPTPGNAKLSNTLKLIVKVEAALNIYSIQRAGIEKSYYQWDTHKKNHSPSVISALFSFLFHLMTQGKCHLDLVNKLNLTSGQGEISKYAWERYMKCTMNVMRSRKKIHGWESNGCIRRAPKDEAKLA